jgi:molecular chaperone DnaK
MAGAFISYVHDDKATVLRLVDDLQRAGVKAWLDVHSLAAGTRWEDALRSGIAEGGFFLACFSRAYHARVTTYMHDELRLAGRILHERAGGPAWFIPVMLDDAPVPETDLGFGRKVSDYQVVRLHPERDQLRAGTVADRQVWFDGVRRLLQTIEPASSFGRLRRIRTQDTSKPQAEAAPLLAVDFGTSTSLAAVHDSAKGWIPVRDENGRFLIPSVVTFTEDWDYYVGWDAEAMADAAPERCVRNVKRNLASGEPVRVGHKSFHPETIAALILSFVRDEAQYHLGREVRDVLMAAPANFAPSQVESLARACRAAGLQVLRFMYEPNAAAIAAASAIRALRDEGAHLPGEIEVLNVDIGGGTTDVSWVEICRVGDEEQIEVLALAGDNLLGGVDFDEAVFRWLLAREVEPRLRETASRWTERDYIRLRDAASRAKVRLSDDAETRVPLGDFETVDGLLHSAEAALNRADLEQACASLVEQVDSLVSRVLRDAGRDAPHFVVLAGRGARIQPVAASLARRFPAVPVLRQFQDMAVGRGLAHYAAVLEGPTVTDLLLLEVMGHAIGVRCSALPDQEGNGLAFGDGDDANPLRCVLVRADYLVPTRYVARSTVPAGAAPLRIAIYSAAADGRYEEVLAIVSLDGARAGEPFELRVDVDADRTAVVTVTGEDGRELAYAQLTNHFLTPVRRRALPASDTGGG